MACFKNRLKHQCAKFIIIISCILIFMGLFSGIFGYVGIDIKATWVIGKEKVPSPVALFGILAILAGFFAVITGILGLCAAKYKKCCFTMPFMIFCIIMSLVMLLVSMLALAGASKDVARKNICDGTTGKKFEGYSSFQEYSQDVYGNSVNKLMCTPICPCDSKTQAEWEKANPKFKEKVDDTSKDYSRVQDYSILTPAQATQLNGGIAVGQTDFEKWDLKSKETYVVPLFWEAASAEGANLNKKGGVFDNFKACFDTTLKDLWTADKTNTAYTTGMEFFSKIETELDCSSACWKPVFGVSRPISAGPVARECVEVMIDSLDSLTAPGVVCLFTALLLMCATCASIPLCSGFDKDEEDLDKNPSRGE